MNVYENVLFMSSLTSGILSQSLLELLELSESNEPGLISIPDVINKMQRTKAVISVHL